jgi:hypothetical protein
MGIESWVEKHSIGLGLSLVVPTRRDVMQGMSWLRQTHALAWPSEYHSELRMTVFVDGKRKSYGLKASK